MKTSQRSIDALRTSIEKQPASRRESYERQLASIFDLPDEQRDAALVRLSWRVLRAEALDSLTSPDGPLLYRSVVGL